jgi:hypothetical protein
MKPKVISLFPLQRFVEAGFSLPDRLEFHFENALNVVNGVPDVRTP